MRDTSYVNQHIAAWGIDTSLVIYLSRETSMTMPREIDTNVDYLNSVLLEHRLQSAMEESSSLYVLTLCLIR